jgi:methionyl-tRNA formyltransferase
MARIVFMGTGLRRADLRGLIEGHDVIGVVTQPDRPAGAAEAYRSRQKQVAVAAGIPVFQPEKLRRPEAFEELQKWQVDVYVVAAFGKFCRRPC